MATKLEHANLVVRELEPIIRFIQTALPEFKVRWEGKTDRGSRWIHLGTETTYVSLNEASLEAREPWVPYAGKPGLNHLGYEVDDADSVRDRLLAAGYLDSTVPNRHPNRVRVYFHDPEGNDWEFVEYKSDDPSARNDYTQPDG
jgi:catechol 2,3-dioxygenase-like lactoylglutathione lyase family enzyme